MSNTLLFLMIAGLVGGLALLAVLAVRRVLARRADDEIERPGRVPPEDALRRMNEAAGRLRNIGMLLHGFTGTRGNQALPGAALLRQATDEAFQLADDLHEYAVQTPRTHVLHDEPVYLQAVLNNAFEDLAHRIAPGMREFRSFADHSVSSITADRRALRHILSDTLGMAVRATGDGDAITVRHLRTPVSFVLRIEFNEHPDLPSVVLAAADDDAAGAVRMTLARRLIEAHGGVIEVVHEGVELTAIVLQFPAARIVNDIATGGAAGPGWLAQAAE